MSDTTSGNEGRAVPGEAGAGTLQPGGLEAVARDLGWKPPDEWKGAAPPGGLLDTPEKYITETMRRRNSTIDKLRDEVRVANAGLARINTLQERAEQRALERLRAEKANAVAEADTERYAQLEKEEREMQEAHAAARQQPAAAVNDLVAAWQAENPWYDSDPDRRAYADGVATQLRERQGLNGRALLDAVTAKVEQFFAGASVEPELDPPPAPRRAAPAVEAGGSRGVPANRRTFDALPPQDQLYAKRYVKLGHGTMEDYLKHYEWG